MRWLALLAACALVAWFNGWVLAPRHFFFADDWGWLMRAQFQPWTDTIHLLPASLYNDRPGGELLIRAMYGLFWLRPGPYNLLWLGIHVANCGLLYAIAIRYLPPARAWLAAVLAGCWFSTLTAVHWIGAVFDLVGGTYCLLALLCYLRAAEGVPRARLHAIAALVLHFIAIRTKEFAIALVVVLAAWEFLLVSGSDLRARLLRLAPHLVLTLAMGLVYASLYAAEKQQMASGAYAMSFSAGDALQGIGYYFAHAFYAFSPGGYEAWVPAGYLLAAVVVLAAIGNRVGIASLLSAAALSAAVLVLARQRHPLYLYVPHFFIAVLLCSVAVRSRWATVATALLVAALVYWPIHTGYRRDSSNFVLIKGGYSQALFYDYARLMQYAPKPRRVHVAVAETYFDPFSWGPGSAIQIYHADPGIAVEVTDVKAPLPGDCGRDGLACFREEGGRLQPVAAATTLP